MKSNLKKMDEYFPFCDWPRYFAIDEDLPPIFWPEGEAPEQNVITHKTEMVRFAAVVLHFPEIGKSELEKQRERAEKKYQRELNREHQERQQENRKIFIRKEKKQQMASWINAIIKENTTPRHLSNLGMDNYERKFFIETYQRFRKYFPDIKVSQKQYLFMQRIAVKFLKIPKDNIK